MTPIKSLAMMKRSLKKAFICKSHFMIMIHSNYVLLFTCLLWDEPAIYFGVRRVGQQKQKKQNHAQEKNEKKLVHKEAWENVQDQSQQLATEPYIKTVTEYNIYASLTYSWDLYNGNVRKEILTFLILFERKVLNRHNFVFPNIKYQCSHGRISINLQ